MLGSTNNIGSVVYFADKYLEPLVGPCGSGQHGSVFEGVVRDDAPFDVWDAVLEISGGANVE